MAFLVLAVSCAGLLADDVRYFEKDGVTYQETRRVVKRPVVESHLEARESTVYRDKYTTEVQDTPRTIPVAITEYHWVPVWRHSWNPFAPPYLAYQMVPQTRWETRSDTVKTSVVRRQVVPEKIVQQVPVTTQRVVEDEIISRVAMPSRPPGVNTQIAAPSAASSTDPVAGGRYAPPAAAGAAPVAAGRYGAPAADPTASGRYAQPNTYAQPNSYGQPNAYAPPGGYGPPSAYGQPNALTPPQNSAADVAARTAIGGVQKLDGDPPAGTPGGWRPGDDSSIRR
jgi:hypothetical protein